MTFLEKRRGISRPDALQTGSPKLLFPLAYCCFLAREGTCRRAEKREKQGQSLLSTWFMSGNSSLIMSEFTRFWSLLTKSDGETSPCHQAWLLYHLLLALLTLCTLFNCSITTSQCATCLLPGPKRLGSRSGKKKTSKIIEYWGQ
jgi:hypothetical protein